MRSLQTIEVDKWVPSEKKGMVRHAGMISPYEAFTQLREHLEKVDLMPEEYFSINPWTWKEKGFEEELPEYIRAECSVHWGGNEGIYMDIALLYQDEKNHLQRLDFATGKTLGSNGDDYLRMSRIAAECSMMLNGRGEIVRFYEDERAFNGKGKGHAPVSQDGLELVDRKVLLSQSFEIEDPVDGRPLRVVAEDDILRTPVYGLLKEVSLDEKIALAMGQGRDAKTAEKVPVMAGISR